MTLAKPPILVRWANRLLGAARHIIFGGLRSLKCMSCDRSDATSCESSVAFRQSARFRKARLLSHHSQDGRHPALRLMPVIARV